MAAQVTGGCACGAVRYESSADPVMAVNCYCRDCQRSTGGGYAPVLLVPKPAFKLTKGELKHHEVTGDSGNKVSRGFCANCGSSILTILEGMPTMLGIKAGSLDDTSQFKPTANIFTSSAPAWSPPMAGLTKFARGPG
ncbi:MAG: GFA family protein [Candidatus Binatus sp.]|uniref:GFA family protein n=1 Tax=Candidatus Binatus sp. TaxID=2811406 RepID=UPI00272402ED|nr:GFA family protein [Candidatus Binatus sp.]MDO8434572.1 GFA family protein [Candidatus Binatus sp.]